MIRRIFICLSTVTVYVGGLCLPGMAQTIQNGDMNEGYITSEGDTLPNGWNQDATRGGCTAYYDQEASHSEPASFRIIGSDSCSKSWSQSIGGIPAIPGEEVTLSGWVKYENLSDHVQIALVRGCTQGGWKQLGWDIVYRGTGTSDWVLFEGSTTVPTFEQCAAHELKSITVLVHLYMKGSGNYWIDDLAVGGPDGTRLRYGTGARSTPREALTVNGNGISFGESTHYQVTLVDTRGKTAETFSGYGSAVSFSRSALAPGTYLIRAATNTGLHTRKIRVGMGAR